MNKTDTTNTAMIYIYKTIEYFTDVMYALGFRWSLSS